MQKRDSQNYWKTISNVYDENVGEKGDIRHEQIINPVVLGFLSNLSGNGYLIRKIHSLWKKCPSLMVAR